MSSAAPPRAIYSRNEHGDCGQASFALKAVLSPPRLRWYGGASMKTVRFAPLSHAAVLALFVIGCADHATPDAASAPWPDLGPAKTPLPGLEQYEIDVTDTGFEPPAVV